FLSIAPVEVGTRETSSQRKPRLRVSSSYNGNQAERRPETGRNTRPGFPKHPRDPSHLTADFQESTCLELNGKMDTSAEEGLSLRRRRNMHSTLQSNN